MNGYTFQDGGNLISEAEGGQVEILVGWSGSPMLYPSRTKLLVFDA